MPLSLNMHAPDTPHDRLAQSLAEHGYVIVEDAAPELAARAREELAPHIEAAPFGHTDFLGARTKRVGALFTVSKAAQEMVIHPTVLAMADRLLLPHCARYQLNFSGIMHLEPGAEPQVLHRDGVLDPFLHPSPPTLMPAMWAISDFTAENGGTQVVPGSHLWAYDRAPYEDEVVNAEMPAGSVLLYTGGVFHGGGRNRSNTVRTGMALQYSLGWLRQEENQYLANPPEVARHYPERLQRLIGYDYGAPYLGFYKGGDPHRVLEDGPLRQGHRTTPELEEAAAGVEWLRWGNVEPVPTPAREGAHARAVTFSPDT
ncbi:MAG: phytanoyl-CoA dioxygenase family protein [Proteobacteria bacterium]|nr:phytanoyl-CoA dioxygenase family protein [Pseudomonadota bacterium]